MIQIMVKKPLLAITMGDPAGIGPEVIVKAFSEPKVLQQCRPFVIGSNIILNNTIKTLGNLAAINIIPSPDKTKGELGKIDVLDLNNQDFNRLELGKISLLAGRASVEWVHQAAKFALSGQIDGLVTGPINKEACQLAGYKDIGHLEILQNLTKTKEVAAMLINKNLRVVHLTTHRPLRAACEWVTKENILNKLKLIDCSFKHWGFPSPRIGVAALNPHAGDGELVGDEEKEEINPAVKAAQLLGMNVQGAIPADTIFNKAIEDKYDVILAMYHDQGHIAAKTNNPQGCVSVTLGLPFVRTSVDHGTAFDIAGKGVAHPENMINAIMVAVNLITSGTLSCNRN